MKINVLALLDDLGIEHTPAGPDNVKIKCINPNHIDSNPSMYLHTEKGMLHCFSCNYTGSLFHLLADNLHTTSTGVFQYLSKYALGGETVDDIKESLLAMFRERQSRNTVVEHTDIELPPNVIMRKHAYLEKRGLTPKETMFWNMRKSTENPYSNWILIPIYFKGVIRSYFMRSTYNGRKRYGPFPRKDLVFGYDSAQDFSKPLYICEGIFDMIFIRRLGVQAVAILSNHILEGQLNILKQYKEIVVFPDNDLRGLQLVYDAMNLVNSADNIHVVSLPEGRKDAAECSLEELYKADVLKSTIQAFVTTPRFLEFMIKR